MVGNPKEAGTPVRHGCVEQQLRCVFPRYKTRFPCMFYACPPCTDVPPIDCMCAGTPHLHPSAVRHVCPAAVNNSADVHVTALL